MKSNRLWAIGTAIAVLAVVALGWVLGISPKLAELSTSNANLKAVQDQNAQHQLELLALQEQFEHIDDLRAELTDLQIAIPSEVGLPDFIRQINTLAALNGVSVESISTAPPEIYNPPATPGTTVNDAGEVIPLPAPPTNLVTVGIVIKVSGTYAAILNFTNGIQNGERLFLVTDLVINNPEKSESDDPDAPTRVVFSGELSGLTFVLDQGPQPAS